MLQMLNGRYRWLVLSAVLFVLLEGGVLAYNFFITAELRKDAQQIELVARHRVLNERIFRTLLLFDNVEQAGVELSAPVESLREAVDDFDIAIEVLAEGGEIEDGNGQLISVVPLQDPDHVALLDEAWSIWASIYGYLFPLIDKDNAVEPDSVGFTGTFKPAILYVEAAAPDLGDIMQRLSASLEARSQARSDLVRLLQLVGLVIAVVYAALLIFILTKRLMRRDDAISEVMGSLERILDFVPQGLFVIDQDLNIGAQASSATYRLFPNQEALAGSFIDLVRPVISQSTLENLKDYLEIMFDPNVIDDLVADLNPLDAVQFMVPRGELEYSERYLKFEFRRIVEGEDEAIRGLLVSVTDVTRGVLLQREIEESTSLAEKRMELLLGVLHVEPSDLRLFLSRTTAALARINAIFKDDEIADHRTRLGQIMPIAHRIKGDAYSLDIKSFAERAHAFEDGLEALQRSGVRDGKDMVALIMEVRAMLADCDEVGHVIGRLAKAARAIQPRSGESDAGATGKSDPYGLARVAAAVCEERNRRARVVCDPMIDKLQLDPERDEHLKAALVQLVRNACAHGIESPDDRASAGKDRTGRVEVGVKKVASRYQFWVRDDGAGLDFKAIRKRAVAAGMADETNAERLTEKELMSMLFRTGFSTAPGADGSAGRGVGLDVVAKAVKAMGGRIGIKCRQGEYTRFDIVFAAQELIGEKAA